MRPGLAVAIAAVLAILGPDAAAPAAKGALKLERIVVVMRHGVRSPTGSPEALSKLTPQAWPTWPVAPGILTDHGQDNVRLMGAWLRAAYARKGLWPAEGCPAPGAVAAWADGGDQRTRVSGQTTLDGAFPGCGLTAPHGPDDQGDGFFSATSQGVCPIDPDQARAAVMAEAQKTSNGGELEPSSPAFTAAKAAMTRVVMGDAPCTDEKTCVMAGASRLKATDDGIKISGPLARAAPSPRTCCWNTPKACLRRRLAGAARMDLSSPRSCRCTTSRPTWNGAPPTSPPTMAR